MIVDYLINLGPWVWFIVALLLFLLELTLPGLSLIWVATAAAIVGIIGLAIPMNWQIQLLLVSILSIGLIVLTKMLNLNKVKEPAGQKLNARTEAFLGQTYILDEDTRNLRSRVSIGDSSWLVETDQEMPAGTRIKVIDVVSTKLMVEKAD